MNPLLGWLYGIGSVFILIGIIWAQLIRRSPPIQLASIGKSDHRGFEAVFTGHDRPGVRHANPGPVWVDIAIWGLFLVALALLVQLYNSDVSVQYWARNSLGIGTSFVNYSYYALLVVSTLAGLPVYRLLYRKWKAAKLAPI